MKIDELLDALGKIDSVYIEEAEKVRFARSRRVKYWAPAAACAALLILGGSFGLWRLGNGAADMAESAGEAAGKTDMAESVEAADAAASGVAENAEETAPSGGADGAVPEESVEGTASAGSTDQAAPAESADEAVLTESAGENAAAENVWKVNEVGELQTAVACGAESPAKVEYYTAEELEAHYGISILPELLPEGYALEGTETYTVGYDADGNVVEDNCTLIYRDSETGGELRISARTVDLGEMTSFADTKLAASVIGGTEVTVGHYRTGSSGSGERDGYLAVYEKDGVTVTVEGTAMKEADFRMALESLLK